MESKKEIYIVDSFTNKPFQGNPAGVCLLGESLTVDDMQSIAKELGLSETAFVIRLKKKSTYSIRYFSPVMEIPLCGHATLAVSKVLFDIRKDIDKIQFVTIQKLDLIVRKSGNKVEMDFPVYSTSPDKAPSQLLEALGIHEIINCVSNLETNILMIEIASATELAALMPDFERLKQAHSSINGVLVTAISERENFDFESRYFWPWSGTNEDPVTGATHTFMASYWGAKLGKTKLNSFQCSERTGFMQVELKPGNTLTIVGEARIIMKGELRI